jgi:hypothetical protein
LEPLAGFAANPAGAAIVDDFFLEVRCCRAILDLAARLIADYGSVL